MPESLLFGIKDTAASFDDHFSNLALITGTLWDFFAQSIDFYEDFCAGTRKFGDVCDTQDNFEASATKSMPYEYLFGNQPPIANLRIR